ALRADRPRLVAAVPPDLVPVLAVARRAVEVAHGQVLDPDVRRALDLDPVADAMRAVDDHHVPVQPADVEIPDADHDLLPVDAGRDHHPVARLRRVDGAPD